MQTITVSVYGKGTGTARSKHLVGQPNHIVDEEMVSFFIFSVAN